MAFPYPLHPRLGRVKSDVHGFGHAEFEPEIGVVEVEAATGEMPVVVVNTEQPHGQAVQAIKAWKDRLHAALPLPLLAMIDLIKEHPIGAALGIPAAIAMTTGSVAVVVDPTILRPPPEVVVITARPTPSPAITVTRYITVQPKTPTRTDTQSLVPRPSPTSVKSPSATPASSPPPTQQPTPSVTPEASAAPEPSVTQKPSVTQEPSTTPEASATRRPDAEVSDSASPSRSSRLPSLDVDVDTPIVDIDVHAPLDAVCDALPIGCPLG